MHKQAHITLRLKPGDSSQVSKGDKIREGDHLITSGGDEIDEFNLSTLLGIKAPKVFDLLVVKPGAQLHKGTVIARRGNLLSRLALKAPVTGIFVIVDQNKGLVGIKRSKPEIHVNAWFDGNVTEVTEDKLVVMVEGIAISGTSGSGDPVSGVLTFVGETEGFALPNDLETRIIVVREATGGLSAKADVLGAMGIVTGTDPDNIKLPFLVVSDIDALKKSMGMGLFF